MSKTIFSAIEPAPADPILGVAVRFAADTRPFKVNLGVGAYLDENGKPVTLNVVRHEESKLAQTPGGCLHYYGPMSGNPTLRHATQELLFGADSEILSSRRAATVQSLGGTGAIRLAADILHTLCGCSVGATSNPTWGNHNSILKAAGMTAVRYRYFNPAGGVDFSGLMQDLQSLPEKSVPILHACCHNPTGYDLTQEQWKEVLSVCEKQHLIPLLDIAYQGFGEGLKEDAMAVRLFAQSGIDFLVSSSFSKNFSLYGERVGALTVVTQSESEAQKIISNAEALARSNYSNPPLHGARIVGNVLSDPQKKADWEKEVTTMRERIRNMRTALSEAVEKAGAKRDFGFITQQKGMFSFTGFTPEQIERLEKEFGIYAVKNGRICLCGLNAQNVQYVAESFAAVL